MRRRSSQLFSSAPNSRPATFFVVLCATLTLLTPEAAGPRPVSGPTDDRIPTAAVASDSDLDVAAAAAAAAATEDTAAIEELSRVFGVRHLPARRTRRPGDPDAVEEEDEDADTSPRHRHRSPPEYMTELYKTIAYDDGISKTSSPYEADIVRGIPDKEPTQQVYFYFNVSHIDKSESVLEAELRLFRMKPSAEAGLPRHQRRSAHLVHIRLYQVLRGGQVIDPSSSSSSESLRLLVHRRVMSHKYGWEVFKVRDVVRQWINDSSTNHGFLVTATTVDGQPVNGTLVRFAQRRQHHDSKQPVLVVFSDEILDKSEYFDSDNYQPPPVADSSLKAMRRNYINFLNEANRANQTNSGSSASSSGPSRRPRTYYMSPTVHQRLLQDSTGSAGGARSRRSLSGTRRRSKRTCQRHEMYVDFEKIGWSGWIISPKGYNAYQCRGVCPFPLGQNQHPSNHATVQSIVHALRIGGGGMSSGGGGGGASAGSGEPVDTPCCVPNKLYSISLLYFDEDENVILKQYDEMVAASCGCH